MDNNTPTPCDYHGHEFVEKLNPGEELWDLHRSPSAHGVCVGCGLVKSVENIGPSESRITYEDRVATKKAMDNPDLGDHRLHYTDWY